MLSCAAYPCPVSALSWYGLLAVPQPSTAPDIPTAGLAVPVLGRQAGGYRLVLIVPLNFSSARFAFLGFVILSRTSRILDLSGQSQSLSFLFTDFAMN